MPHLTKEVKCLLYQLQLFEQSESTFYTYVSNPQGSTRQ